MTRPSPGEFVAFGIATAAGCQAFRHRHLIRAFIWARRLKAPGPVEEPDPTAADPVAVTTYLATHRAHRRHP